MAARFLKAKTASPRRTDRQFHATGTDPSAPRRHSIRSVENIHQFYAPYPRGFGGRQPPRGKHTHTATPSHFWQSGR